jgi:hypothetical protein
MRPSDPLPAAARRPADLERFGVGPKKLMGHESYTGEAIHLDELELDLAFRGADDSG